MSEALQATGMVLSAMPIGENDKRVVLLTRELGKISCFARGARRPGNHLMAASSPAAFGRFSLMQTRDAYVLIRADIDQYFREFSAEPLGIYYAYYFLEFADYYGREGIEATDMLNLLYLSMKALLHENLDNRLVRRIFELRTMVINGEYAPEMERLSESAHYTVQYICRTPLTKLYSFMVTPEILKELETMLNRHMDKVIDRPLRSRKILDDMIRQDPAGAYGKEMP